MHIKENLPKLIGVNFKDGRKHDKCGFIAFHKCDGSSNVPQAKIGISLKCTNANSLEERYLLEAFRSSLARDLQSDFYDALIQGYTIQMNYYAGALNLIFKEGPFDDFYFLGGKNF